MENYASFLENLDAWQNERNVCFLIYQMGKVASTTIYRTLRAKNVPVFHTHNHNVAGRILSLAKCRVQIITGVREPLARTISAYFQNIDNPENWFWYLGNRRKIRKMPVGEIIRHFDAVLPYHLERVVAPWFDEFRRNTGIGFDDLTCTENVYRASRGNVSVMIYKVEKWPDFRDCFLRSYGDLTSIKEFRTSNVAENKWCRHVYEAFQRAYEIGMEDYAERFGKLDFVREMYSEAELRRYIERYVSKPGADGSPENRGMPDAQALRP